MAVKRYVVQRKSDGKYDANGRWSSDLQQAEVWKWKSYGYGEEVIDVPVSVTIRVVKPRKKRGWISVKDRWPKPHQNVWCLNRDGSQFEGRPCYGMHEPFFTYPRGDGDPSNTAPDWVDVTHWMPLPAPPHQSPPPEAETPKETP